MMTILDAFDTIRERWGDAVAEEIIRAETKPMRFDTYLAEHCFACGGDWGKMLLSGVHELYPEVWDAIPEHMGVNCFNTITLLLVCLGIEGIDDDC